MDREFLLKTPFPQSSNPINILIIGSMILVLLFSLLLLALPAFDEQFEEDPALFLEINITKHLANDFFSGSGSLGVALLLLFAIMRLQYLEARIGEKRFLDSQVKFSSVFHGSAYRTAPAYGTVFFCSIRWPDVMSSEG